MGVGYYNAEGVSDCRAWSVSSGVMLPGTPGSIRLSSGNSLWNGSLKFMMR